jgi:Fe-S-cluster containining protein
VVTDLVQIRQSGTALNAENQHFRRYVAAHHLAIEPFQILATQIQQQIDCRNCANCCRYSIVAAGESDIERVAAYLGVDAEEVRHLYTDQDPDTPNGRILRSNPDGCVFLDGNLCVVYEARPKACRDFPHVTPGARSLGGRFSSLCRWAALCPIIYNALEGYKHLVGYHPGNRHQVTAAGKRST